MHGEAFLRHLRRQLRERRLHPIVDIDRVDIGVGSKLETDGQIIAAVIAARRFHVDHFVDADHLGFQRLRDGAFDDLRRGAWIGRGHLNLRRHDVGKLRYGNAQKGEGARDRDDDRDDDRKSRPIDENRRNHSFAPKLNHFRAKQTALRKCDKTQKPERGPSRTRSENAASMIEERSRVATNPLAA